MTSPSSSYYPTRTRWPQSWRRWWYVGRRANRRRRLASHPGIPGREFLLSVLVPGCSFRESHHNWTAIGLGISYFISAILGLAFIGSKTATIAFAILFSIHCLSLGRALTQRLGCPSLRARLVTAVLVMLMLYGLVYRPLHWMVSSFLVVPFRVEGHVVLVNPRSSQSAPQKGDLVFFRVTARNQGPVRIYQGNVCGVVLGESGDQIRFQSSGCEVNDIPIAKQSYMPVEGTWVVPEKYWFIWPRFSIFNQRAASAKEVAATMASIAMVSQTQIQGRAYHRWFGRRMELP